MAFTRIRGAGIHTAANINSHNINSTGIITAVSFVGNGAGLTGIASTDNIITGTAATFNTYPVDINAGMTVAGVSSFSGAISGTTANFSGNVTVGGVLTYEDVKNVDSIGIVTARTGLVAPYADIDDFVDVGSNIQLGNAGVVTATLFNGTTGVFAPYADIDDFVDVGSNIQLGNAGVATATLFSGASQIGIQSAGTQIGAGITQLNFVGTGNTFAVNGTTVDISIQGGGGGGSGAFTTSITGIQTTSQIVGIGTTSTDDSDLQGIGNSARGMYVSNGMIIMDNLVSGNHYIGTNFNGLMVGPVNIEGTISIDGNYVVV